MRGRQAKAAFLLVPNMFDSLEVKVLTNRLGASQALFGFFSQQGLYPWPIRRKLKFEIDAGPEFYWPPV
jgi:hypothetical protein